MAGVPFDMGDSGSFSGMGIPGVSDYVKRRVTVEGGPLGARTFDLPEDQDEYEEYVDELKRQEVQTVETAERGDAAEDGQDFESEYEQALKGLGFSQGEIPFDVRDQLEANGVDPDHPDLQAAISLLEAELESSDGSSATQAKVFEFIGMASTQPEYALPAATQYDQAYAESGFTGSERKPPITREATAGALMASEGQTTPSSSPEISTPKFQESGSGWFQHRNGTLVTPEGQVVYDPTSNAPGSYGWTRNVVANWSAEKVTEWKQSLVQFGYMSKEQAKDAKVTSTFLQALAGYHESRYVYGKPMPQEASDAAAGGSGVKPVDLQDLQSEIRNNVREEYRRIYGTEPSDGEIQTWSNYIIKTGMDLQRKFISKYDTPNTSTAVSEATESFVDKLESSPDSKFLRESDEENTRLRETFDRMAQVTNSLAT